MTRRLLIAGYGFLGKALKPAFADAGWRVTCVNRSGREGAIPCDLSSKEDTEAIRGDYDLVIHCAASGGGDLESYRDIYLTGSRNLLARFSVSRIIFTSSTSVYPQSDDSTVDEESLAEPVSPRSQILREAEEEILAAGGVVARLSGLYGPNRCHVLKNFLAGTAKIDGAGERIMNFVHRVDVSHALLLLANQKRGKEIYNINGGHASQRDVYASLAKHFGLSMPIAADSAIPRKRGNTSKIVSSAKLKALGWCPRYSDFLEMALACDVH